MLELNYLEDKLAHSQSYILNELQDVIDGKWKKDKKYLYQLSCINYKGQFNDGSGKYTEVIAGELLKKNIFDYFNNIRSLERISDYYVKERVHSECGSNRKEEHFCFNLKKNKIDLAELGVAIDFQIPLKPKRINEFEGVGKIDLLSKSGNKLYIIELKCGKNKDTLLHAVLEVAYYYQWLYRKQFLIDLKKIYSNLTDDQIKNIQIAKALLLEENEELLSFLDLRDINNRVNLRKLILKLNVGVFTINSDLTKTTRVI
jgi:hypothetical protein